MKRRKDNSTYLDLLQTNSFITPIEVSEGDVPWRFTFSVDPLIRRDLIDYLLKNGVPVSDWYPVVTPIFGIPDKDSEGHYIFPGASFMEERILNLPLVTDAGSIKKYTEVLNSYIPSVK